MGLAQYEAAITTLTAALSLAPSNRVVRLNRAIANLRAGKLEAAQADTSSCSGRAELLQSAVRAGGNRLAPTGHECRHRVLPAMPFPKYLRFSRTQAGS